VYVDCTAGAGGHTALIAERLGPGGRVIAIDRDPRAVELTRERVKGRPQAVVIQGNYGDLAAVVGEMGVQEVDGVLIDAGLSSVQLDDAARGFSFQVDGPLDMRMDDSSGETAAELLARTSERGLTTMLHEFGDVPKARRVAREIVKRRESKPIARTRDLVDVLIEAYHTGGRVPEETRQVFQAVRIAVNDELGSLERGIRAAIDLLKADGRLICITFHSGEDRVVKNVLRDASRKSHEYHADGRLKATKPPKLRLLTRRPVTPGDEEIRANPRAHSARLRAAERIGTGA
jgi:16S rRNA (cytosine1402-N4)-methyltransferase